MIDDKNKFLSTTVFIFTVIGFGIGMTGYIGLNMLQDPVYAGESQDVAILSILTLLMILISLVLGPIIAAVTGFLSGMRADDSGHAMTVSMFGAVLGFYLMTILALTLSSQAMEQNILYTIFIEEKAGYSFIITLVQGSVPTGVVGLLSALIGFRIRD